MHSHEAVLYTVHLIFAILSACGLRFRPFGLNSACGLDTQRSLQRSRYL